MIIDIALYIIKSSGAAWRGKLSETLMPLGCNSSEVDTDVLMKRNFKPNGLPYYNYMSCYVDNLLHIGFQLKDDMDALNFIYKLTDSFVPPDR